MCGKKNDVQTLEHHGDLDSSMKQKVNEGPSKSVI